MSKLGDWKSVVISAVSECLNYRLALVYQTPVMERESALSLHSILYFFINPYNDSLTNESYYPDMFD